MQTAKLVQGRVICHGTGEWIQKAGWSVNNTNLSYKKKAIDTSTDAVVVQCRDVNPDAVAGNEIEEVTSSLRVKQGFSKCTIRLAQIGDWIDQNPVVRTEASVGVYRIICGLPPVAAHAT